MAVLDGVTSKWAQQPDQDAITAQGDAYLRANFPGLTYIASTSVTAGEEQGQ